MGKNIAVGKCNTLELQLKMIRSILSVSVEKFHLLDSPTVITAHEGNILKDDVEILTPFEEVTDAVQVDLYPSSGYVLPCIRGLKHQLTKMSSKYHSSFVKALKSSLHSRMVTYEMNNTYILAATLDPRFKLIWCHDNEEKETVKSVNPLQTIYLQPLEKLMEICILYRKYLWQRSAHAPETQLLFRYSVPHSVHL